MVRMLYEMRLQPRQELPSNVCPKQTPSLRSAVKILNTYAVNSHPAVLDGFIDLVREEQRSRVQVEKTQQPRTSVREKLKQEPPAHKPAAPKKREPER